jgi:hypothetical protein
LVEANRQASDQSTPNRALLAQDFAALSQCPS